MVNTNEARVAELCDLRLDTDNLERCDQYLGGCCERIVQHHLILRQLVLHHMNYDTISLASGCVQACHQLTGLDYIDVVHYVLLRYAVSEMT